MAKDKQATQMLCTATARHVACCAKSKDFPPPSLEEVAIVGRSNCGKSTLINALSGQKKVARTSSTPGCTRQLNFFEFRFAGSMPFWLVDLPGYGFAKVSKADRDQWDKLITSYIEGRSTLRALLLLADIRRELSGEEQMILEWAERRSLAALVVLTKADKLAKNQRFCAQKQAQDFLGLRRPPLLASAQDKELINKLRQEIVRLLEAPVTREGK